MKIEINTTELAINCVEMLCESEKPDLDEITFAVELAIDDVKRQIKSEVFDLLNKKIKKC